MFEDIIVVSLVPEEQVDGKKWGSTVRMWVPEDLSSLVVISALSRCECNAYVSRKSQRDSVAENFKATETIVRQRSCTYAPREAGEGAQALANARAHWLPSSPSSYSFSLSSLFFFSLLTEETASRWRRAKTHREDAVFLVREARMKEKRKKNLHDEGAPCRVKAKGVARCSAPPLVGTKRVHWFYEYSPDLAFGRERDVDN